MILRCHPRSSRGFLSSKTESNIFLSVTFDCIFCPIEVSSVSRQKPSMFQSDSLVSSPIRPSMLQYQNSHISAASDELRCDQTSSETHKSALFLGISSLNFIYKRASPPYSHLYSFLLLKHTRKSPIMHSNLNTRNFLKIHLCACACTQKIKNKK